MNEERPLLVDMSVFKAVDKMDAHHSASFYHTEERLIDNAVDEIPICN